MNSALMNLKKGYKKAVVQQRTTAKGQHGLMGLAASKVEVTPVLENQKRKGPILLSVNYRQEVGPFRF